MSDLPPIRQKVQLDITDYKTGAAQINREMRVIDSGFRASAAAMGEWSKTSQGLELRIKTLSATIELQKTKVAATTREYERLAAEKGANSRAAQDMQIKLNKEVETLNKLQNELGQTSTAMQKVEKSSGGMKGAFKDLSGNLQQLGQQVPALGTAMSLLSNPITLVGAGIGGLIKLTRDWVQETLIYNDTVDKMRGVTGLAAEEISRIIQVADDWKIDLPTVQSALEMMNKKGISPSIENLAAIADQYVATADKSAFMEEATKKYGKSFGDLIPILKNGGQALRDATGAVDDNLIATDESIKKSRDFAIALDNLQDKAQGLGYTVGNDVIPVLTDFLNILDRLITESKKPKPDWFPDILPQLTAMKQGIDEIKLVIRFYNAWKDGLIEWHGIIPRIKDDIQDLDKGERDLVTTTENLTTGTEDTTDATKNLSYATGDLQRAMQGARSDSAKEIAALEDLRTKGIEKLEDATMSLVNNAIRKYTDSLTETMILEAAFKLALGEITQAEYDQTVAIANSLKPLEEMAKLVEDGTLDISYLKQAMDDGKVSAEELEAAYRATGMSAEEARLKVKGLTDEINAMPERKQINVDVVYNAGQMPPPPGNAPIPKQHGGVDYVTRPTLFLAGEAGDETVITLPKGKTLGEVPGGADYERSGAARQLLTGSTQIGPIILQGTPERELDMRKLARYVADEIQRRQS